jgi:hypothetical protein
MLTDDERDLLARGEISDGRHIGGGITSLFVGLGIGQAVQGRYGDTGWIFTLGELGSATVFFVGVGRALGDCFDSDQTCGNDDGAALLLVGLAGLTVFRVWEIVDAFSGPTKHNARVRELRSRLGMPPMYSTKIVPYIAPSLSRDGGGTAGVTIRF